MHSGSQFKAIQPVIWEIKAVGAWAAVTVRKQRTKTAHGYSAPSPHPGWLPDSRDTHSG